MFKRWKNFKMTCVGCLWGHTACLHITLTCQGTAEDDSQSNSQGNGWRGRWSPLLVTIVTCSLLRVQYDAQAKSWVSLGGAMWKLVSIIKISHKPWGGAETGNSKLMTQLSGERALSGFISSQFIALTFISQCLHHCKLHRFIVGMNILSVLKEIHIYVGIFSEVIQTLTLISCVKLASSLYSLNICSLTL